MNVHHRQRGVAVITALLIVALAATISTGIAIDLQLEVRRTGNLVSTDQALFYINPAERLAMNVLDEDARDNSIDHPGESWAFDIPPIPVEGGHITGKITDMQACFNLNSVSPNYQPVNNSNAAPNNNADADGQNGAQTAPPVSSKTSIDRLKRLLASPAINISPTSTDALLDWIDVDVETTVPNGAEDGYYLNLERPHRTANQSLKSVSTLRLVRGFEDAGKLAALLPFVCAIDAPTSININTAPAEVLISLDDDIDDVDVATILQVREETPFQTINEFIRINDLSKKITDQTGLSVSSNYFLLTTYLEIGNARKVVYSIINRTDKAETKVIARMQNTL